MRLQSAMEYLMTYGWALLAIAVVLAVLALIGVFNPLTFSPKAEPGACSVYRANGPFSSEFPQLQGPCTGLLPKFVAVFGNGAYASISGASQDFTPNSVTLAGWVYPDAAVSSNGLIIALGNAAGLQISPGGSGSQFVPQAVLLGVGSCSPFCTLSGPALGINQWYFIAETYNDINGAQYLYVNGQVEGNAVVSPAGPLPASVSANIDVGALPGNGDYYYGMLANLQVYNATLGPQAINTLYLGGIGAEPTDLTHLVGWWPLNGNANDYSGDSGNMTGSGITYSGTWYTDYSKP